VEGLPFDGLVSAKRYRIDETYSNAYAEWRRQGMPDYPEQEAYRAIKARDGLESPPDLAGLATGGRLTLQTVLPTHAVELLVIQPV
ncbi:MAG TPA: beta-xylosidase, partial [Clostridia bacterium]